MTGDFLSSKCWIGAREKEMEGRERERERRMAEEKNVKGAPGGELSGFVREVAFKSGRRWNVVLPLLS